MINANGSYILLPKYTIYIYTVSCITAKQQPSIYYMLVAGLTFYFWDWIEDVSVWYKHGYGWVLVEEKNLVEKKKGFI